MLPPWVWATAGRAVASSTAHERIRDLMLHKMTVYDIEVN
jgi:hypothetical protein